MIRFKYATSCVDLTRLDANDLLNMMNGADQIERSTFVQRVNTDDRHELELSLGYELHPSRGPTCSRDFHVRYYHGRFRGQRVYVLQHSAIEYIFTSDGTVPPRK